MTDTLASTPDPDDGPRLEVRWYQDPEGRVMQTLAASDTVVSLPDEWTLLPDELGARLFAEQEQHAADRMARALADAADEAAQVETRRVELLEQFADRNGLTVADAAILLGVPQPGDRPGVEPARDMLPSSTPTLGDNVGL